MDEVTVREIERKKKYLKRYKRNVAQIIRLKSKLSILNDRIYSLKSPTLSDMPRGGDPVTIADLISDKQDLEARIERLKVRGRKLKSEILDCIDGLDMDPKYAEVLESFFIDCKDFDQIADEMVFTERHVIRLYSDGIKAISIKDLCQ